MAGVNFRVGRDRAWRPSYSLPSSGNAVLIGTNVADDVKPASHSSTNWSYALFENYGSGAFVESYSQAGAFAIAGNGGHGGAAQYGLALFDFETAAWSYNTLTHNLPTDRATSLTGTEISANNEVALGGVTGNVPAPSHIYGGIIGIDEGTKGALLLVCGMYMGEDLNGATDYAYKLDLNTRTWSRYTSNLRSDYPLGYPAADSNSFASHDTSRSRVYMPPRNLDAVNQIPYVNLSTAAWGGLSRGGGDPSSNTASSFYDPTLDVLVLILANGTLRTLDLSTGDLSAGRTTSGTVQTSTYRWWRYPTDGCFYTYPGSGSTLYKLDPPATVSGTWAFSTVSIGGATIPTDANASGNGEPAYTTFFYVPAIECFAFIGNTTSQVALIKP